MKSLVNNLLIILVLSALVTACGAMTGNAEPAQADPQPLITLNDDVVSASAEVVAGKWANLSFILGAEKVDVAVKIGSKVKTGDVLASFPDDALPQGIINAQADLILAQKSLDDLLDTNTALAQMIIAVRDAQKAYDKAVDYREGLDGLITYKETVIKKENTPFGVIEIPTIREYEAYADKTTIAKADEDLALKKALLDDAQAELDRLINLQTSPEVQAAQIRVNALESVIRQSKLTAPFDGTVVQLYVNSGEMISPGVPILLLADLSTLQVKTTDLNEVDVARIQIGDTVKVSFDALPDTVVTGMVNEISLKNAVGSGVYYDVFVTLDEIPEGLRWGMSAFVEIEVSK
ncbi:MAG: HlyD family efflux transporter periplasmic adaptor subunit [Anaerolineales bacterium]|nr:HlyD family efflux transporter periplasmic adaptor subunit [Anaerolineales bacterium]